MALYDNTEYFNCNCGNNQFEETEVFRIEKTQVSSTLTKSNKWEKISIGKYLRCLTCGKLINDFVDEK